MSRKRSATSETNGKKRNVVQHAKLPPRKRPSSQSLKELIRAANIVTTDQEIEDLTIVRNLRDALAPFLRYADGEGHSIR